MPVDKITALEMEISLSSFLDYRRNLIIPNVSWSFFNHELDLCMLSKAGYCTEIEIKIDKYDLIKDKEKRHSHNHYRIKYLYFAIPDYLIDQIHHIPEQAGIFIVRRHKNFPKWLSCKKLRKAKSNPSNYKFNETERVELMRLLCLRIWRLKKKLGGIK